MGQIGNTVPLKRKVKNVIDDLRGIAIFAKVAEEGSFSAASRSLGLSTSVVSHHVKMLEDRHGVAFLRRSTRALSLTSEGQRLFESAKRMVDAAEEGLETIANTSEEPAGSFRITAPTFLANSAQEVAIWQFSHRYPNVSITVHSTDVPVNLIAEGFDLAIRLGSVSDGSLESQKIGTFERCLVAAPSYLDSIELPVTPKDLARCDFVSLNMLPKKFILQRGGAKSTIQPPISNLQLDSVASARSALLAGMGMQRLPLSEVADDLSVGRLVRVLPEWSLPTLNIYAAWPASNNPSSLLKIFLEIFASHSG